MRTIHKLKRLKLSKLKIKFENFRLKDDEIILNIYNRLKHIKNKFSELREILSNGKMIRKFLRVILRKQR
jgi:hypothetical protein